MDWLFLGRVRSLFKHNIYKEDAYCSIVLQNTFPFKHQPRDQIHCRLVGESLFLEFGGVLLGFLYSNKGDCAFIYLQINYPDGIYDQLITFANDYMINSVLHAEDGTQYPKPQPLSFFIVKPPDVPCGYCQYLMQVHPSSTQIINGVLL